MLVLKQLTVYMYITNTVLFSALTKYLVDNNIHEKITQFWLVKINAVFR